jgi:Fanconi anemia group M protein
MNTIQHPLVVPGSLESRQYQLAIAMRALEGNTMVVLPTGLGKTAVALLVAASRLFREGGRVLMLAPTKPLVEQHHRYFTTHLILEQDPGGASPCVMFTGESPPDIRRKEWEGSRLCMATPQVVKNDVIGGSYTLDDVTLLIVDECHRAVGNYAYVFLAQRYTASASKPLILAMTASPGSDREKVDVVMQNLAIAIVESRTERDPDVSPYVHERELEVVTVDLPAPLREALNDLSDLLAARLTLIANMGFQVPKKGDLSMKEMNALNAMIQGRIQERDPSAFTAASVYAECMKLRHAIAITGSQGSSVLRAYLGKLHFEGSGSGASKASSRLARDPHFIALLERTGDWHEELHPKLALTAAVVTAQVRDHPESRIIVFSTYRETVQLIVEYLSAHNISCERFVGQATKDTDKGLSQKKQIAALQRFRNGEFQVLVSTSVGEEGLDVPSTDMVVFYEAVPSEIRSIQRKGRTGRSGAGRIVVLVTKGTADEVYRFVSQSRERAMQSGIQRMQAANPVSVDGDRMAVPQREEVQASIAQFIAPGPAITVDDRETNSRVVERLSAMGANITLARLPDGDYAAGDRVVIERKTSRDFVDTLVTRDLLGQLRALAQAAVRPVLIIEGFDLYTHRDIQPNAIRGALAAIALDIGIALLFTSDEEETAQMIMVIARREASGEEGSRERGPQVRKVYQPVKGQQEAILAAFPDIGLKQARNLLSHFGSVHGVLDASEDALREVPGIGEKKASSLWEISHRPYL